LGDGFGDVYFTNSDSGQIMNLPRGIPPTLSFSATGVGDLSSQSQVVTLRNIGNVRLTLDAISFPASFPEGASGASTDCSTIQTLAAGGSCPLTIAFRPASAGTLSSSLKLTDNSLGATNATQNIALNGTGVAPPAPAKLTTPVSGSMLTSSTVTFTWSAGTGVTQYDLHIGTTGAGSSNIFGGTVTGQSKTVTGIPTTGATLNVRLYSLIAGAWQYVDYTFTEASPAARATMSSPAPSSTLTSSTVAFSWTAGTQVTQYDLHIGTTGVGSSNIFAGTVTGTSKAITGIPTTGGTLNVRLYSLIAGAWQYNDYTYTEQ